jgi:hypothetical protein
MAVMGSPVGLPVGAEIKKRPRNESLNKPLVSPVSLDRSIMGTAKGRDNLNLGVAGEPFCRPRVDVLQNTGKGPRWADLRMPRHTGEAVCQ